MTLPELEAELVRVRDRLDKLDKDSSVARQELIVNVWNKIVDTQMHFNEMVMRVRNLAITLVLAVFGAAAYSIQSPLFVQLGGREVHISLFIISFGLVGWVALGILDVGHFHMLLRGAVKKGMDLEKQYSEDPLLGHLLGMTTVISGESRRFLRWKPSAGNKITTFYVVVLASGLLLCGVIYQLRKSDLGIQNREQVIKLITGTPEGLVIRVEQQPTS